MPAVIDVITEKDIRDLVEGTLDPESQDAVARFVERDAEAGAVYRAALTKKMRNAPPSERFIRRAEKERQVQVTGTAWRVLSICAALVVSAFVIAGMFGVTV